MPAGLPPPRLIDAPYTDPVERVGLSPQPPRVGEALEFRTFQDIMADALIVAHLEVGTDPQEGARCILARLARLGLTLAPHHMRVREDGTLEPFLPRGFSPC